MLSRGLGWLDGSAKPKTSAHSPCETIQDHSTALTACYRYPTAKVEYARCFFAGTGHLLLLPRQ